MSLSTAIRPGVACTFSQGNTNAATVPGGRADAEAAAMQHSWGPDTQLFSMPCHPARLCIPCQPPEPRMPSLI